MESQGTHHPKVCGLHYLAIPDSRTNNYESARLTAENVFVQVLVEYRFAAPWDPAQNDVEVKG